MKQIEDINQKYLILLSRHGFTGEIQCIKDKNQAKTDMIQKDKHIRITINLSKVDFKNYEDQLSYLVRKAVLPCLRLETDRLILRRFEERDASPCFEFLSDRMTCYMDGGYEPYAAMDDAYMALMDSLMRQETRYMIVLKKEDKAIGTINLFPAKDRVVEAMEIGYVVSPSYRRQGYAYEAVKALTDYLLEDLHLELFIAGAFAENISSQGLLKKLGFQPEGKRRKAFWYPPLGAVDLLYYYLERN